mgnify:CR=1 FL=1
MPKVIHQSDVKILASTAEEISAEYIWTNCIEDAGGNRYYRMTIDGGASCVVRVLFADENFCQRYSAETSRRYKIKKEDRYVVMSAHYRREFGGVNTYLSDKKHGTEKLHRIDFKRVNKIWGLLLASWHFPVLQTWLSIILGLLSLALGVISICK